MKIIPSESYRREAWKNGGGITHEIARQENADGYDWRISLADMTEDAVFSRFPKMARILTVIQGAGLNLTSESNSTVVAPLKPTEFDGDVEVSGVLTDGSIRNFNLIFDKQKYSGSVKVFLEDTGPDPRVLAGETIIAFVATGTVQIGKEELAEHHSAILFDTSTKVRIPDGSALVCVSLQRRHGRGL